MSEPMSANPAEMRTRADAVGDGTALVWDLVRGVWRFAALHAMVDLGCADHLAAEPLSVADLAGRCDAHGPSLARVLREMAACGLVRTVAPGTYALTEAGTALRAEAMARLVVPFCAEQASWYALGALPETVRTGHSAFTRKFGTVYDYLASNAASGRLFREFMAAVSQPLATRVTEVYDFGAAQTVVDVGGGNGTFLAAILNANPRPRGVLLELEHSLPAARELLTATGVVSRCEFVAGDFFVSVPAGADVYLLANVLHNWDDDDAVRILRTVRRAIKDQGQVLLVDAIVPDDDSPHFGKDLDIRMLSLFGGGRERTEGEYAALLGAAGLSVHSAAKLPLGRSLVEALPG